MKPLIKLLTQAIMLSLIIIAKSVSADDTDQPMTESHTLCQCATAQQPVTFRDTECYTLRTCLDPYGLPMPCENFMILCEVMEPEIRLLDQLR